MDKDPSKQLEEIYKVVREIRRILTSPPYVEELVKEKKHKKRYTSTPSPYDCGVKRRR
jgi:hypothetical protein